MKRSFLALAGAMMLAALPAAAQNIIELIDNSEGYFNVAPNIVVIEGADGIYFCKFELGADVFDTYAQGGDVTPGDLTAICINAEEFEN